MISAHMRPSIQSGAGFGRAMLDTVLPEAMIEVIVMVRNGSNENDK